MATVPDEIESRIADGKHVAFIGTCTDGHPHVAPLWYRYEDGMIEITTTGRKLENLRTNEHVAFSIQTADEDGMPEWMVSIQGTATVIDDDEASDAGRARIHEKYGIDADAFSENVLVQIDIGTVSYTIF